MITGFGRLGTPFAAQYFDVMPDMITMAKGLTNGAVPVGAVAVRSEIYEAFMRGPTARSSCFTATPTRRIRSPAPPGSPRSRSTGAKACSRARTRSAGTGPMRLHALKGRPHVIDLRNLGLIGAIELEPIPGKPGARGFDAFLRAFEKGC